MMTDEGWLNEVQDMLRQLTPPHVEKKRVTILALVDARLAGNPEESIWKRTDTCSRSTYHEKWKRDPVFASVLDAVAQKAIEWRETEEVRALRSAARKLALASPTAVDVLVGLLASVDETERRLAAGDLLDRASTATSEKHSTEIHVDDARERLARLVFAAAARSTEAAGPGGSER
jgi:hypothetical protein